MHSMESFLKRNCDLICWIWNPSLTLPVAYGLPSKTAETFIDFSCRMRTLVYSKQIFTSGEKKQTQLSLGLSKLTTLWGDIHLYLHHPTPYTCTFHLQPVNHAVQVTGERQSLYSAIRISQKLAVLPFLYKLLFQIALLLADN